MSLRILVIFFIICLMSFDVEVCSVTLEGNSTLKTLQSAKKVYVKEYVDLGGRTIYLTKKSKLICKDGKVTNGEIVFNDTEISGKPAIYCKVSGIVKNDVLPADWFLADNDLDPLYERGFFKLTGMKKIELQTKKRMWQECVAGTMAVRFRA